MHVVCEQTKQTSVQEGLMYHTRSTRCWQLIRDETLPPHTCCMKEKNTLLKEYFFNVLSVNTKTKENHQGKVIWATMKKKKRNYDFQDFGDCFQILEKCSHGNKFLDTVRIADAHYFCTETILTFALKLVRSSLCSDLDVFISITYIHFISASSFTYCIARALSG